MSLKKKSKSLGHLTALGSPHFGASPRLMKKHISVKNFNERLRFLNHSYQDRNGGNQPSTSGQQQQQQRHIGPPVRSSTVLNLGSHGLHNKSASGIKVTTPKKLKGLVRQKTTNSMPNPVAMGRAILAKANHLAHKSPQTPHTSSSLADVFSGKDASLIPNKHRTFLMDTQVKSTVGLQCQERNLFLFNDLLLIAKERSSSQYKLKDQIPLADVWLSNCISEVSEVTLDPFTSFVIGWPISNAVITFSSPSQRAQWWDKLTQLIEQERSHTPQTTNIQVTYFDQATNFEHVKSLLVNLEDNARDCIRSSLQALDLRTPKAADGESKPEEASGFQLWVRTKLDESPYPLIGHEIPLVIKLHWTRQTFNMRSQKSYDEYKTGIRCQFILRRVGQRATKMDNRVGGPAGSQKTKLKKVKSSIKLQNVFRRVSQGGKSGGGDDSNAAEGVKKRGQLFGKDLAEVCKNNCLPTPIENVLHQIFLDGPTTVGIFRRSPNARAMRELREKLDHTNDAVDFSECSVFVTAALLKEFLRTLPDCLLMCEHYSSWVQLAKEFAEKKMVDPVKSFVSMLPRMNGILLQHMLYLLNKIAALSQENMMTISNLSICVGPSVLWSTDTNIMMDHDYSKDVSSVTQLLVEEYFNIFGNDAVPYAFRDIGKKETENEAATTAPGQTSEETKKMYENSSLDSLLDANDFGDSLPSGGVPSMGGFSATGLGPRSRVQVSSAQLHIQRALVAAQQQQQAQGVRSPAEGVSLTNLSHDSGLTTSDSQLYAFEDMQQSFSSDAEDGGAGVMDDRRRRRNSAKHWGTTNGQFQLPGQMPRASNRSNHFSVTGSKRRLQGGIVTNSNAPANPPPPPRERMYKRIQSRQKEGHRAGWGNEQMDMSGGFVMDTTAHMASSLKGLSFLRRTASEESLALQQHLLLDSYNREPLVAPQSAAVTRRRRPAAHRKGRAPAPPGSSGTTIVRSNSVGLAVGSDGKRSTDWYRSRSTTRLNDEPMESSSCETLSDEDSTPHISRSNSYGRKEEDGTVSTRFDGSYDIYLHDSNLNESFITPSTPSASQQHAHSNVFTSAVETPPGYEETISRQRLLKHFHRSNSFVMSGNSSPMGSSTRLNQHGPQQQQQTQQTTPTGKSRLIQHVSASTQLSEQQAPPLPPKTDRPPLPPKQRISRFSFDMDDTYANSAELRNHHQNSEPLPELVYPAYTGPGARIQVSVKSPPQLPPKERSGLGAGSSDERISDDSSSRRGSVTRTKIVTSPVKKSSTTQTRTMCNAETQTDETDFYVMYQDEDGVWHEEEMLDMGAAERVLEAEHDYSEESNRSLSPDYYTASYNNNPEYLHMGGPTASSFVHSGTSSANSPFRDSQTQQQMPQHRPLSGPVSVQAPSSAMAELRQAGRRKLEPVLSVPNLGGDPIIQGEINWSVSQLRTLFNQGQQSPSSAAPGNDGSSSSSSSSAGGGNNFTLAQQQQHLQQTHLAHQDYIYASAHPYDNAEERQEEAVDSDQESYV